MHDVSLQFGSCLQVNTPNLAKKFVVLVPGYEEDVREGDASYQSIALFIMASSDKQM